MSDLMQKNKDVIWKDHVESKDVIWKDDMGGKDSDVG